MITTAFNRRLNRCLLEADDLTKISRTLADAGEETVNRRDALRRGAGAVAAGMLSGHQATASIFKLLKDNPKLWTELVTAAINPGHLSYDSHGSRKDLTSEDWNAIKSGLFGSLQQRVIGPISKVGKKKYKPWEDRLSSPESDALKRQAYLVIKDLNLSQLSTLGRGIPSDLIEDLTKRFASMLDTGNDRTRYNRGNILEREQDIKLAKTFNITGTDILRSAMKRRQRFINFHLGLAKNKLLGTDVGDDEFDEFETYDPTNPKMSNELKRQIDMATNGIEHLVTNLQRMGIPCPSSLTAEATKQIKQLRQDAIMRFDKINKEKRDEQLQANKKSQDAEDQYDLMRWEGEGGALGPTNESKFARRLSRILLAKSFV